MTINFNVDPYHDDFDQSKDYHRILFKPGYAVQARELTQSQTILQDQVTKFADNIFKQNSPVTGGQITTNLNCYYIKLTNPVGFDVTQFNGKTITDTTGTIVATVLQVAVPTGTSGVGDPPTLIVSYKSGVQFVDNDVLYDVNSNLAAQAQAVNSTGLSSVASIAQGVFYISSSFVTIHFDNGYFWRNWHSYIKNELPSKFTFPISINRIFFFSIFFCKRTLTFCISAIFFIYIYKRLLMFYFSILNISIRFLLPT